MAEATLHPRALERPANVTRSLFHVLSGVGTVLLIELVLDEVGMIIVALSFAGWAWSLEIGRRISPRLNQLLMWFFGPVAHAHEKHVVNSSTWYMTALVLLALTTNKLAAAIGVIILAVGDPAAAFVGRAIGRTKLVGRRTLEGVIGFVVAAAPAALAVVLLFHPEVGFGEAILLASAATTAGAAAELFAIELDDNFLIPAAAGSAALLISVVLLV